MMWVLFQFRLRKRPPFKGPLDFTAYADQARWFKNDEDYNGKTQYKIMKGHNGHACTAVET